nr:integrase, catalytic region, zinc finger, CCHC-type, peptidase aspartic, catalytic [Tanacetum cinerariifolium]
MNYLEEQTDGEAMINSIKNGDQPLPRVTQVSIAGTSSTEQPPLKDKSINKTTKELWDALARHMLGSKYGEQDRKVIVLYEYETFKATEGELLLDTYIRYLQVINDLKKCGYSKGNRELNFKFLNNLQPEWKQDVNEAMGLKKKTVVVTSDPLALIAEKTKSANKKQKFVKTNDKKVEKKDDKKKRDMSRVKCYNCKKEGHFAKDCKKSKVKDYNYYKTKMLLAKKDSDEQVLLAEDQAWMESSSDSDREINVNMVFMAQIEKVLFDSEASSSSADEKISEVSYYLSKSESESEYETSEYYDNTTTYGLFVNDNDDQEIFHECKNFYENLIESQIDHNESVVDLNDSLGIDKLIRKSNKKIVKCQKRIEKANQQSKDFENQNRDLQDKYDVLKNQATTFEINNNELNEQLKVLIEKNDNLLAQMKVKQIADQEVLFDKMSVQLVELDKHVRDLKNTVLEKDFKISELKECVRNKYLEIEKCLERLNVCENKLHKMGQINQTVHIIMSSKDSLYNGRKGIGFENPSYFEKAKDLRPTLYDEKVIGLGYIPMFLTYSAGALEIEKFKRARENKIEFTYDYGNLNASYQTSSLKPYVLNVILEKIIIDLEDEVVSLLEKEKANLKTIESLKSKGMFKLSVSQSVSPISMSKTSCDSKNVENLDTFSSVRRPSHSSVIWKKKWSSNTSNVELSSVSHLKLNKDVKRYSRKDLLSCNNSHLGKTSSAFVCNDAMNVSCNSRMFDLFDKNNLFIFDDESVKISLVSKMPFRKKPRDSMNVRSKSNLNKSLPRTMHKWLPKMQPLAEPVAKWILKIVQIYLWINDSGCSKHMTGNRALLMNFVEKFLGTVRFGNNDFVVIAGYGDVVIGSMTIKKVYYVKGLGHNLFSVGQFCDKVLEVAFRKSTCFIRNEDGVDLLTGDRSSNLYTIALNKVASNSSTCLLAKASSSQSWLWHQRLSYLNFATINNLVKNNLVQGFPKMKFEKDHLCFACE